MTGMRVTWIVHLGMRSVPWTGWAVVRASVVSTRWPLVSRWIAWPLTRVRHWLHWLQWSWPHWSRMVRKLALLVAINRRNVHSARWWAHVDLLRLLRMTRPVVTVVRLDVRTLHGYRCAAALWWRRYWHALGR